MLIVVSKAEGEKVAGCFFKLYYSDNVAIRQIFEDDVYGDYR